MPLYPHYKLSSFNKLANALKNTEDAWRFTKETMQIGHHEILLRFSFQYFWIGRIDFLEYHRSLVCWKVCMNFSMLLRQNVFCLPFSFSSFINFKLSLCFLHCLDRRRMSPKSVNRNQFRQKQLGATRTATISKAKSLTGVITKN